MNTNIIQNNKRIFTLLVLLIIIVAIPLTVFIAQKQQEIRQRAAETEEGEVVEEVLEMERASGEAGVGQVGEEEKGEMTIDAAAVAVPGFVPSSTVTPPPTPRISTKSCLKTPNRADEFTVSWTGSTPVAWVNISPNQNFNPSYRKVLPARTTTTTGPSGFRLVTATGLGAEIILAPNTDYYVRTVRTLAGSPVVVGQAVRFKTNPACLQANLTINPSQTIVGRGVTFSVTARGGTSPYRYIYNFGDGRVNPDWIASNREVPYYSRPGNYTGFVKVKDSRGQIVETNRVAFRITAFSTGGINGVVRQTRGNAVLPGVTVSLVGYDRTTTTDAAGAYRMSTMPAGSQRFTYSKAGYIPQTLPVNITAGRYKTQHVQLVPGVAPTPTPTRGATPTPTTPPRVTPTPTPTPPVQVGWINGTVRNLGANNALLPGVTVLFVGTARTTTTNATGGWEMRDVPSGSRQFTFSKTGFVSKTETVIIPVVTSISFHIQLSPITPTPTPTPVQLGVTLQVSTTQPLVGQPVTFTARAAGGRTPYNRYTFRPGDGQEVTQASPTLAYTYRTAGNFSARVIVFDAAGASQVSNYVAMTVASAPTPTPTRGATPTPTRPPTPTPTSPPVATPTTPPVATPTPTTPPPPPLPTGEYGDNTINIGDYNTFLSCFEKTVAQVPGCEAADLNDDGVVDSSDFLLLFESFQSQYGD